MGWSVVESREKRDLPITVLRYHDFRWLWVGQFVSVFGTQMHNVALSWQVYQITGSVAQLGLLGLVRAVALMVTSLVGGAVADRSDRRRLMFVTQSLLLALSAGLAFVSWVGVVNVALLYLFAMLSASISAFDGPARQALIPTLVPRNQLAAAMSLFSVGFSLARMVGPAAGGLAIAWIGVSGTYALDAASFLAVLCALLVMQTRAGAPAVTSRGIAAIVEGWRFIISTPIILGVMLIDFFATLFGSTVGLAPVFAEDVLGVGPTGLGLLLASPAAGTVVGATTLGFVRQPRHPGRTVAFAVIAYGVFLALFGLSTTLAMAMLFLALAGAADGISVAMRHTVRNLATPDHLRGRVAAAHSALAMGGPRLGEFQSGMTAALIGPRPAMVAGGLLCVLVAIAATRLIPEVKRYSTDDLSSAAGGDVPAQGAQQAPGPPARAAQRPTDTHTHVDEQQQSYPATAPTQRR